MVGATGESTVRRPIRGDIVAVTGSPDLWTVTASDFAGDHFLVRSGEEVRHVTNRSIQVAERATTGELEDDFPCCAQGDGHGEPARPTGGIDEASIARNMYAAAETVKETGGAVEINGVRMEACDEYGRTDTTRAADEARAALRMVLQDLLALGGA